jgi:phosphoribosyl 1,2-cyclic phosphodiesterase
MKKNLNFTLKFWGVRGSHPVSGEAYNRYGGHTSCVEIRAGQHTLIFDAGTGIIGLGKELAQRATQSGQSVTAVLFFSHLHHDHTQGFPFFVPAYFANSQLDLFVPAIYERDAKAVLTEVMSAPTFPVSFQQTGAQKQIHRLQPTQIILLDDDGLTKLPATTTPIPEDTVVIRAMWSYAHPQGVMIYRVEYQGKSVVYATDTEGYAGGDQRLVEFARGADLLIHDAQYTQDHYVGALAGAPVTQGYGHSTAAMACDTAQTAKVGQLVLFHHDPNYADQTIAQIERQARELFANTVAAREGQVVNLGDRLHPKQLERKLPMAKQEKASSWVTAG